MVRESEVREKLTAHLQGHMSLDDFDDWLVAHSWNMHQDSSPSAQELVSAIELSLFEHSSGHLSDAELRSDLGLLADNISTK